MIFLKNYMKLQFCGEVGNLNECGKEENALVTQHQENDNKTVQITEVRCFCPKHRYFKMKYNTVSYNSNGKKITRQVYKCTKVSSCAYAYTTRHLTSIRPAVLSRLAISDFLSMMEPSAIFYIHQGSYQVLRTQSLPRGDRNTTGKYIHPRFSYFTPQLHDEHLKKATNARAQSK